MRNTVYTLVLFGRIATVWLSCPDGRFLGDGNCFECPNHCITCQSRSFCAVCHPGYKGDICQEGCEGCKQGTPCDRTSGICTVACSDGRSGTRCDKPCNMKCVNCTRSNSDNCEKCVDNMYGKNCELKCSNTCENEKCHDSSGECVIGCTKGYWGKLCLSVCPSHCKDKICHRFNGTCQNGCANNYYEYYGEKCLCPVGCTCEDTGYCKSCTNGSKVACDERCSEGCEMKSCNAETKECLVGCSRGYSGRHCTKVKEDAATWILYYFWVFILIAILVIVVGSVFCYLLLQKRKRAVKKDRNKKDKLPETEAGTPLVELSHTDKGRNTPDVINKDNTQEVTALSSNGNKGGCQKNACYLENKSYELQELEEYMVKEELNAISIIRKRSPPSQADVKRETKIAIAKLKDYKHRKNFKEHLITEFQALPSGLLKPIKSFKGRKELLKNRFRGIYAYDENRIKGKEYINASYIDGYCKRSGYIASEGPTRKCLGDMSVFWDVVWRENCSTIVMLSDTSETEEYICDKYWPDKDQKEIFGTFSVECVYEKAIENGSYRVRSLKLDKNQDSRSIKHMQYTSWAANGVPQKVKNFIQFGERVNDVRREEAGPLLVHCSSGGGRTGTFIALDILSKEVAETGHVDVFSCVSRLREQRVNMVQTLEQYMFLFEALMKKTKNQELLKQL